MVALKENETGLIEQIRLGDMKAFREFVQLHEKNIANIVIGMLGNTPEAEEIAHDAFLRFFYNIRDFREESSSKTYLTRIAINLSLNELKKRKLHKERYIYQEDMRAFSGVSEDDPESFEIRDILEKELQKLEEGQRAVFILRILEGYNTKETADILHIPLGTVLSRLHRALEILKIRLKEFKTERKL